MKLFRITSIIVLWSFILTSIIIIFVVIFTTKTAINTVEQNLINKLKVMDPKNSSSKLIFENINILINKGLFFADSKMIGNVLQANICTIASNDENINTIIKNLQNIAKDKKNFIYETISDAEETFMVDKSITFTNPDNFLNNLILEVESSALYKFVRSYVNSNEKLALKFYVDFLEKIKKLFINDVNLILKIIVSVNENAINLFWTECKNEKELLCEVYHFENIKKTGFSAKNLMRRILVDIVDYENTNTLNESMIFDVTDN